MQFGKGKEPLRHVELERLPKLATLSMTGDWKRPLLGDEGFEHLDTFTNLWKIELGNSRVTDRTIDRMMKLPRLQRVDLHNTRTTETAADRLRANGPEGIEVRQSGPRK